MSQSSFEPPQRCVPPREPCLDSTNWSSHHVSRHDWLRDTRTSLCQHGCPSFNQGGGTPDQD